MKWSALVSIAALAAVASVPIPGLAQQGKLYDRNEVPGAYTLGLYANESLTSHEITFDKDVELIEAFIAIAGDSTRVFSGAAFGLDMPFGVELDGAIRWRNIPGLKQMGSPTEKGMELQFWQECQEMTGTTPVALGRVRMRVSPTFEKGEVTVRGHKDWGLSVELCDPEASWPKPYATGLSVTLERKTSLWSKITSMFK